MKKLLALLLSILAVLTLAACSGDGGGEDTGDDQYKENDVIITEVTDEGGNTFRFSSVDSNTIKITGFESTTDAAHAVKLPAYLDGKRVVGIATQAFETLSSVSTLIFPTAEEYAAGDAGFDATKFSFFIESYAFRNCDGLEYITIPSYVSSIGEAAFYGCLNLKHVVVEHGQLISIGTAVFMDCTSLITVALPGSIEIIGQGAFLGCEKLTTVALSEGLSMIVKHAFYECKSLQSLTLPASLTSIGSGVFSGTNASEGITYCGASEEVKQYLAQNGLAAPVLPPEQDGGAA